MRNPFISKPDKNPRSAWKKHVKNNSSGSRPRASEIVSLCGQSIDRLLPQTFKCKLSLIVFLDLSNNSLLEIPEEMPLCMPSLKKLDIQGNRIHRLPETMGLWKEMHLLTVGDSTIGNPLDRLPRCIRDMTNLRKLNLNKCWISHIEPYTFGPSLKYISLIGNRLSFLDLRAFGSKLEYLNLTENQIELIETGDHHLPNLTYLLISSNRIKEIPKKLPLLLPALVSLDLGDNEISKIHPTMELWKNMNTLKLGKNHLKDLNKPIVEMDNSNEISSLNCPTDHIEPNVFGALLEHIDLSYNKISYLEPGTFSSKLKYLDLKGNQLQHITSRPFLNLDSLESLVLSSNVINHLSEDFVIYVTKLMRHTLKNLFIEDNKLLVFPSVFLSKRCNIVYTPNNPLFLRRRDERRDTPESRYHKLIRRILFHPIQSMEIADVFRTSNCYQLRDSGVLDDFLKSTYSAKDPDLNIESLLKTPRYEAFSLREIALRCLSKRPLPSNTPPHYQQMVENSARCFVCQRAYYEECLAFLQYIDYISFHGIYKSNACSYSCWKSVNDDRNLQPSF